MVAWGNTGYSGVFYGRCEADTLAGEADASKMQTAEVEDESGHASDGAVDNAEATGNPEIGFGVVDHFATDAELAAED